MGHAQMCLGMPLSCAKFSDFLLGEYESDLGKGHLGIRAIRTTVTTCMTKGC